MEKDKIKIFKRKIYEQILNWKNSPIKNSALLIEGARRIGKSTIVEEFAKKEFPDNYLIIDFRHESDEFKNLFTKIKNLDEFYRQLFLYQNKVLKPGGLIIFDEIQFCQKAREAIKDFVNDGRFYFIETGSLISIKDNTINIMIPSEERRIEMFPMDFEEYLWASENNSSLPLLNEALKNGKEIPLQVHEEYLEKFRTYMILGGMPKVLSIYLETNSFVLADEEKRDILKLYRDDLRKIDNAHKSSCLQLFNSIPSQLAKENKRFKITELKNKKRYDQIEKSFSDLADFKIVNKVNCLSSLESPLTLNAVESKFKLYFLDTGLLFTELFNINEKDMNKTYFDFIKGKKNSINFGSIYESIAVQQLKTHYSSLYYFTYKLLDKKQNKEKRYEIDIVLEKNFKVQAIEIKSSKNYTTSSLDNLKIKYSQLKENRYVFGVKNIKREDNKITVPIYLLPTL